MRHILCPVDFSELSSQALSYAGRLARACGARITVLYADLLMPPPYFTEAQIDRLEKELRQARRGAEARLRAFAETALGAQPPEFEVAVVEGLAVDSIEQAAAERGVDLVVIGTHGRSGVSRWILGSVAERVLSVVSVPVLLVRAGREIRRIVAAAGCERAAAAASELAGCLGAELRVEKITGAGHPPCDLLVLGARHAVLDAVRHAACPVLSVAEPAARQEGHRAI